jgi:Tol biopolymer transport system component
MTGLPSISADGQLVAYMSDRSGEGHSDIWVQHVNDARPARLTRHPANDILPSISPDGSRVAFRSERDGGGIYVVSTLGGEERKIADHGTLPLFSPDGAWIAYVDDAAWSGRYSRMFIVPAAGGAPRPFQPDFTVAPFPANLGPIWSPDGRSLLFSGAKTGVKGSLDWWVAPVDGGPAVATGASSMLSVAWHFPCAWVGRHVLMGAGSQLEGMNLHRVRISPGDFRVTGPPEPLTSGVGMIHNASVARDGRIALSRINWLAQLWGVDSEPRDGSPAAAPQLLTRDGTPKSDPAFSRDGARLVYSAWAGRPGQRRTEIRVRNLASGEETVAVQASGQDVHVRPHANEDGSLLGWQDRVDGKRVAFVGRPGDSAGREVCRDCTLYGFFSDSRTVLAGVGSSRLVRRSVDDGTETPLAELAEGLIFDADLSWDDRWLALTILRPDGSTALQIVPVAERAVPATEWIPIPESASLRSGPRWSPEGDRIYAVAKRDGFQCVWAQALDPATKRPFGAPVAVFHAHRNPWIMWSPPWAFSLAVGRRQIVFNAAEISGNVLIGQLPPE